MCDEQTKFCSKCKTEKSTSDFTKNKGRKGDLRHWCRLCSRRYLRDRRKAMSAEVKYKKDRNYNLGRYGINTEIYNKMFEEQQGHCAICGKHQSELKRVLDVEHNHLTKEIRGLTCSECNTGLGKFRADEKGVELLEKAINYLKGDRNEDA